LVISKKDTKKGAETAVFPFLFIHFLSRFFEGLFQWPLFLPLVLLRGSEGVEKPETERLTFRTGKACPPGEDWSVGFVRFPQERYLIQ